MVSLLTHICFTRPQWVLLYDTFASAVEDMIDMKGHNTKQRYVRGVFMTSDRKSHVKLSSLDGDLSMSKELSSYGLEYDINPVFTELHCDTTYPSTSWTMEWYADRHRYTNIHGVLFNPYVQTYIQTFLWYSCRLLLWYVARKQLILWYQ